MKSYFGSRGVAADHLMGQAAKGDPNKRYALINDQEVRTAVIAAAAKRFGYPLAQVRLRLYVCRFAGSRPGEASHQQRIRGSRQNASLRLRTTAMRARCLSREAIAPLATHGCGRRSDRALSS